MINKQLASQLLRLVFWVLLLGGCSHSENNATINIQLANGSITVTSNGEYLVKYKDDSTSLKNVKTFIVFDGVPYFEVQGGKILKWTTVLSDKGLNLQKVWDKLYYITKTIEGVEWDKSYLHIINSTGETSKIELQYDNKPLSVENYSMLSERILVEKSYYEFCISDKSMKIVRCYQWPDVSMP